jgi:hexosaminidase
VLEANVAYGDLAIQYRVRGGGWKPYKGPVEVKGPVELRSVAPDGKRVSRTLRVDPS